MKALKIDFVDLPKLKKVVFRDSKAMEAPQMQFRNCPMFMFKELPGLETLSFSALTAPNASVLHLESTCNGRVMSRSAEAEGSVDDGPHVFEL